MDLDTAKRKVAQGEYSSVEEALQDLRQIWENCRIFNAEGSEILLSAEACAELTEALIEVDFIHVHSVSDRGLIYFCACTGHYRRSSVRSLCRRRKVAARGARAE